MLPCLCLLQYSIVAAAESIQRKRIFGTPALLLVFGGRNVRAYVRANRGTFTQSARPRVDSFFIHCVRLGPVLPPHYHNAFVLDSEQHYIHFRVTVRLHCNLLKK
jgi:hypothetical protein